MSPLQTFVSVFVEQGTPLLALMLGVCVGLGGGLAALTAIGRFRFDDDDR